MAASLTLRWDGLTLWADCHAYGLSTGFKLVRVIPPLCPYEKPDLISAWWDGFELGAANLAATITVPNPYLSRNIADGTARAWQQGLEAARESGPHGYDRFLSPNHPANKERQPNA